MERGSRLAAWGLPALEVFAALAAAVVYLAFAATIRIDPLERMGQISGLASLQLRFAAFAVPLVAALIVAARVQGGAHFAVAARLVCAAFAGLASGFVAGAILLALRGTPWCLNANAGDMMPLVEWAKGIHADVAAHKPPPFYPPAFPHFLAWYMNVVDEPGYFAMKHLQIAGTLLFGPVAYLTWRLLLRPGWALGIGVVAMLVVIDPYKPHANLVLIALVPLLVKFLQVLRRARDRHPYELVKLGVGFGLVFGLLLLVYSGWFRWSAPGALVAAAIVLPWRGGKKHAAIFVGATLVVFTVVIWGYLSNILEYRDVLASQPGGGGPMVRDEYVFFDVVVDPAYFAMWKGDLPGLQPPQLWPPPGELGGLGVYTVLLFAAFGAAIAFARQRTAVIVLGCVLVGVWLSRFWEAKDLWATKLVQLYPRTSIEIAYLFVVIAGFAIYYLIESVTRRIDPDRKHAPSRLIGAVCGLGFLFASAGSSIGDRYMPVDTLPRATGWLAFLAHHSLREKVSPD